jgi:hypothetical protein
MKLYNHPRELLQWGAETLRLAAVATILLFLGKGMVALIRWLL